MTKFFQVTNYSLKNQLHLFFNGIFKAWDTIELYQKAWEIIEKYISFCLGKQHNVTATQFFSSKQEKSFTGDNIL